MKKKKKIIIILGIAAVIVIGGYFGGKYLVVNYVFDKMILQNTLSIIQNQPEEKTAVTGAEENKGAIIGQDNQNEETHENASEEEKKGEKTNAASTKKSIDEMTTSEVAAIISGKPELISRLESIVSYADKQRVMSILMSNFTKEEIAEYSAKAVGGISPQLKSELAGIARSRLTSAQWSECMNLFAKYVNDIKPYIK